MEIEVNIIEEEKYKLGDTYHKRKKEGGKKDSAYLIHIEGDYGYVVFNDEIKKVNLEMIEVTKKFK